MSATLARVVFLATSPEEVGGFLAGELPAGWQLSLADNAGHPDIDVCDYLVVAASPVRRGTIERAARLRLIHKLGVGYDDIDVEAAAERGIAVAVCPLGSAEAVAEHTLALTLAALKQIPFLDAATRGDGRWPKWEVRSRLRQLGTKTVGIVGAGRIGQMAARFFAGFGCTVLAYTRTPGQVTGLPSLAFVDTLDELFGRSDIVSLHAPLSADTRGMVGEALLRLLGPDGLLVNTARGDLVDEVGLVRALSDGGLGCAALDVIAHEPLRPDDPLRFLPNVLMTPHIGGGGIDVMRLKAAAIAQNLARFHAGQGAENTVPSPAAAC